MAKKATDNVLQEDDKSDLPKIALDENGSLTCQAFTGGKVVDTTGAGDSFIGGFLSAIWSHGAANDSTAVPTDPVVLGRALRIASRVAARKIEKAGARSGLPKRSEDDILTAEFDALLKLEATVAK